MDGSRKRGGDDLFPTSHKKTRPKTRLSNYHFPNVENAEESDEATEGGIELFVNQDGFENDENANHAGIEADAPEQSPSFSSALQPARTSSSGAIAGQDSRRIRSSGMHQLPSSNARRNQPTNAAPPSMPFSVSRPATNVSSFPNVEPWNAASRLSGKFGAPFAQLTNAAQSEESVDPRLMTMTPEMRRATQSEYVGYRRPTLQQTLVRANEEHQMDAIMGNQRLPPWIDTRSARTDKNGGSGAGTSSSNAGI